jgi:hypothetical protein
MTQAPPHPQQSGKRSIRRLYLRALKWVLAGWSVVAAVVVVASVLLGQLPSIDLMGIALGSGAIACLALLPGLVGSAERQVLGDRSTWQRLTVCLFAGMAIRLSGTVALFLTCRYHMATPTELIAGMIIGWYVLLTSLEVNVLAREIPKAAKAPNLPETSLG